MLVRIAAVATLAICLIASPRADRFTLAADTVTANTNDPTLQETLEKGLKVRRPEDFAYVAAVVAKVEDGTLPRKLVEGTFLWARNKRPHPFVYFQEGLNRRAKKIGVRL